MKKYNPKPQYEYEVIVRCYTYNQSKFIKDAVDGIIMQKTNFPFVCVLVDDCSKDGEQQLLEEYIKKESVKTTIEEYDFEFSRCFVAKSQYNSNCLLVFYLLKENLYKQKSLKRSLIQPWIDSAKYEAVCEGDDYWISPTKIQEQFDFLNANKEYLLVGSNGIVQYNDTKLGLHYFNNHFMQRDVAFEELVNNWVFPTASMMYSTSIWNLYPEWSSQIHYGDDMKVMLASIHGKVATLGTVTCVYRKGVGITATLDKQLIYMHEQHLLFYSNLLNDTGDKYRDILVRRIAKDEENIKFYTLKEKSLFILLLKYPKRCMRLFISNIYRSIKLKYKKND